MFHPFPMALLVCAALVPTVAWPADPADPADPAAPVPSVGYRSTIDGYRSHAVEPVGPWRDANDRVGRQGGAHAHGAHVDQPADQPADDPHAGHAAAATGAPADAAPSHDHGTQDPSTHDHGAHQPGAHDHRMHQRRPAADAAGKGPHTCMHHDTAGGDGMKHLPDACPMKKESGHAHH